MQIQNARAGEIIRDQAGLTLAEGFPQNLSSSIVPVMDMTPRFHRTIKIARQTSTTTSATVFSSSDKKRTFICGVQLTYSKDASNLSNQIDLRVAVDSVSTRIIEIAVTPSTAQNGSLYIQFPEPLLIDKNASVTMNQEATAQIRSSAIVYYVEID